MMSGCYFSRLVFVTHLETPVLLHVLLYPMYTFQKSREFCKYSIFCVHCALSVTKLVLLLHYMKSENKFTWHIISYVKNDQ
jgi:hypothetical protein